MNVTRRNLFRTMAAGAAAAVLPGCARAEQATPLRASAVALLYDATLCIGCQACVAACAEANGEAGDTRLDPQRRSARELNSTARNIVKIYKPVDGSPSSYIKQQCMHCVDPACVASCMFHSLHKDESTGIVRWDPSRCVGCRYCEIVCPYHIPKFEWSGINPRIVKCELCAPRLASGMEPACSTVCPTHAVIFGQRTALMERAHQRIAERPGTYFENRVYGATDGGGTQALYLARVPFDKLGLTRLGPESIPAKYLKWQKRVYTYFAAPTAVYAVLLGVLVKRWRSRTVHEAKVEQATGLRPQL
jgi:Fe-S-cluster-containing dehydrogenase component